MNGKPERVLDRARQEVYYVSITQFDVPIGHIKEGFPGIVGYPGNLQMQEGARPGLHRLSDQMHVGLLRRVRPFTGIAADAGTDDIFPGRLPSLGPGQNVIDIEVFAVKFFPAILAGEAVTQEDVLTGELDVFLRQPVKKHKYDDLGDADFKIDGVHAFIDVGILRSILPFLKIEGLIAV